MSQQSHDYSLSQHGNNSIIGGGWLVLGSYLKCTVMTQPSRTGVTGRTSVHLEPIITAHEVGAPAVRAVGEYQL